MTAKPQQWRLHCRILSGRSVNDAAGALCERRRGPRCRVIEVAVLHGVGLPAVLNEAVTRADARPLPRD